MQLMQKIPTTLEGAGQWPLRLEALRLDTPKQYEQLRQRVAKYVNEVMPSDEEAIAEEVRRCMHVVLFFQFLSMHAVFLFFQPRGHRTGEPVLFCALGGFPLHLLFGCKSLPKGGTCGTSDALEEFFPRYASPKYCVRWWLT